MLTRAAAQARLIKPFDTRKTIKGMTLSVPVLMETKGNKTRYLMLRVPDEIVRQIDETRQRVPRERFLNAVNSWMEKNQRRMREQYDATPSAQRRRMQRFDYDIMPFSLAAAVTPSKIEPGRPARVAPGKVTPKKLPALPSQIKVAGTEERPVYHVYPARGRWARKGVEGTSIVMEFDFGIEGLGQEMHFTVHFTASQLTPASRINTGNELVRVFETAIRRRAAELDRPVETSAIRGAMTGFRSVFPRRVREAVRVAETRKDAALRDYLLGL